MGFGPRTGVRAPETVWLLLLPFRIFGIAVDGVLKLFRSLLFLPSRILGGRPGA